MIGRELDALFPQRPQPGTDTVLEVRDLEVVGAAGPVSFSVRGGEIVGLAGLVGAGRTELLEAIFGSRRSTAVSVLVHGRPVGVRARVHRSTMRVDAVPLRELPTTWWS